MKNNKQTRIFPEKTSIEEVLKILADNANQWDCTLEEAFSRMLEEQSNEKN